MDAYAEMKPCPFCGNTDIKVRDKSGHYGLHAPFTIKWQVSCDHCCTDMNAPSQKEVCKRWNRRMTGNESIQQPQDSQ